MYKTTAQINCFGLVQTTLTPVGTHLCIGWVLVWWRSLIHRSRGLRVEFFFAVVIAFVDSDPASNYCGWLVDSRLAYCGLAALLLPRAGTGTAAMAA